LGLANSEEDFVKISARASDTLTLRGLHLGTIMRAVCKSLKCEDAAGGHPPAAGGRIRKKDVDLFLLKVNEMVKTQLKKSEAY
jgi:nanoRNase/pAp phosphatase (c-di-AMP/oligoRNAs hydrolase)